MRNCNFYKDNCLRVETERLILYCLKITIKLFSEVKFFNRKAVLKKPILLENTQITN